MSHVYKKVASKPEQPLSFVQLVTKYGDQWALMVPAKYVHIGYEDAARGDRYDAHLMREMERGVMPRVREWRER